MLTHFKKTLRSSKSSKNLSDSKPPPSTILTPQTQGTIATAMIAPSPKVVGEWPVKALKMLVAVEEICDPNGKFIHGDAVGLHHRELAKVLQSLHPEAVFTKNLDSTDVWFKYHALRKAGDDTLGCYRELDQIRSHDIKYTYCRALQKVLGPTKTAHLEAMEKDLRMSEQRCYGRKRGIF